MSTGTDLIVMVYWRPGCPYCRRLRTNLHRLGLPTREVNIWEDPAAAEIVRRIASGNETVPTVVVGPVELVNPRVRDIIDAVGVHAPELLENLDTAMLGRSRSGSRLARAAGALRGVATGLAHRGRGSA